MTTSVMSTLTARPATIPGTTGVPAPIALELVDAGRTVGWIVDDGVAFGGFADQTEATHAAWLAHRTLMRRLARTHGLRPLPVDSVPLAVVREAERNVILANGQPIAELLGPDADGRVGPGHFGFQLRVPQPADELRMRALAHLVYRALRKSGIRWALWRPTRAAA